MTDTNGNKLVVGVTVGVSALVLMRGQLAWFRERGWSVTLITTPDEHARAAADREKVKLVGIPMHRGLSPVKDLVALIRWLRALCAERPDAINVGTPKAALLGGIAAWICRVPVRLYVVRGLRLEGARGLMASLLWLMEWLTMRLATDVVFVSRSLASEAISQRLLPNRKSWVIGAGSSNGVDAQAVAARVDAAGRSTMRSELGITDGDFVVGFVGRVTRDKGVAPLVEAFAHGQVPGHVRLLVVGPTEDAQLKLDLESLGDRVISVGWTDDVWGHLAAMDMLCLPTEREGFPNVVLEASAAGLPVVTTRATGAVDSVVHGVTGFLVDVGDSAAMAERISELATGSVRARAMGEAARERVRSEFRPETVWEGYESLMMRSGSAGHVVGVHKSDSEMKVEE